MVPGDGSTFSRDQNSAAELDPPSVPPSGSSVQSGSSSQLPRLASSETVINSGKPNAAVASGMEAAAEGGSIMTRLFPPAGEAGSTYSTLSPAGIELDHFRIEERIGLGGMGAVFRAVDTRLQRHVALKLLAPSQSYDESSVRRFQNEARAAARLDHENVARVYYIGEERGLHFIAFEYVTGSNVRDLIRAEGRISPADAVNYALQIAFALKHTAAMGVVHRDIKPSNVIITPTGRAKLVDLGLARKDNTESQGDLTLPGTTLGTFDYISPEQAKDPRSVDVRSDIYSLGCTMYHMLTGQPPYPEGTVLQKLLDHQGKEAPDPAAINPRVPEQLSAVVRRMMNSDRNRRYQTPELLIRDLTYVAATLGLRGANPEGLVWVGSRAVQPGGLSRHAGWLATVAILFGVVGLLSAFPQLGGDPAVVDESNYGTVPETLRTATGTGQSGRTAVPGVAADNATGRTVPADHSSVADSRPSGVTEGVPADGTRIPGAAAVVMSDGGDASPNPVTDGPENPPSAVPDADASVVQDPAVAVAMAESPKSPSEGRGNSVAAPGADTDGPSAVESGTPTDPEGIPDAVAATEYPVTLFSSDSQQEESYRTLESACAAAADGSTIELRFNGRLSERSFRIVRKNITIRAARGFRPVIEFAPTDLDSTDATVRMISVVGGPLHIINVEFRLMIPDDASADSYAMFGISRNETLRLDQVTATFVNPNHRPVSMLEVAADASQMPPDPATMPVTAARSSSLIELANCFVRGEASLAQLTVTGKLELSLENSAVAVEEMFRILPAGSPVTERPVVSLSLDHVSALLHGSLLRLSGPLSVDRPTVELEPRNCIITAAPDTPLVTADEDVPADEVRRMLFWRGQRNFYDRIETYLAIVSADEIYGFEEWRQYWGASLEVGPWSGALDWASDARPVRVLSDDFSRLSLEAFQLAQPEDRANPAIDGATDGNDAGADLSMLTAPWQPAAVAEPEDSRTESTVETAAPTDGS